MSRSERVAAGRPRLPGRLAAAACALLLGAVLSASAAGGEHDGLLRSLGTSGWVPAEGGSPRTFGPENLYEEIDGEAELFLPYGFREMTAAILSRPGGSGEVRLELFLHETPRDAFGVYSQHRFPGQETVRVGPSEAVVSDASLDFFRGRTFVRIRKASPGASRAELSALADAVVPLLPGGADPPRETEVLAVPGLVPGSVAYQVRAIRGYDALAPGFEARVAREGAEVAVLYRPPRQAGEAVRELLSRSLPGFRETAPGRFAADLPSGPLYLVAGEGVAGVAGRISPEAARPILDDLCGRLPGCKGK